MKEELGKGGESSGVIMESCGARGVVWVGFWVLEVVLACVFGYLGFSVGKEDIGYGSSGIKFQVGACLYGFHAFYQAELCGGV